MRLDRFPGVEVTTRAAPEGLDVTASYSCRATNRLTVADIERVEIGRAGGALLDRKIRQAAFVAMQLAAADVLRIVRADWSGFWNLGMEIIGADGVRGRVVRIDYGEKLLTVQWSDAADTGPFGFQQAIEFVQRGHWRLFE